jgi:hypothetical protein
LVVRNRRWLLAVGRWLEQRLESGDALSFEQRCYRTSLVAEILREEWAIGKEVVQQGASWKEKQKSQEPNAFAERLLLPKFKPEEPHSHIESCRRDNGRKKNNLYNRGSKDESSLI